MTHARQLLDEIHADPGDPAPQLVIADLLAAEGDPRGELIVLDHVDRTVPGGLGDDMHALERLLFLGAEYTFPCARDPEPMLAFRRSADPMTFEVDHAGRELRIVFLPGDFRSSIEIYDGDEIRTELWDGLDVDRDGISSPDAELVILTILSDALRAGSPLGELEFPWSDEPLPVYPSGPLRAYRLPVEFLIAYTVSRTRYGIAARDYDRWHALWRRLARLRRGHRP